ncbi:hypothetical protein [Thermoanaerobacterium sp. DL9XJH110]|uniref:hypothetical protein n=1 Tax=Thermoanaerobacterium sp. DL9XJH110 TaxID=3386643 RepID=UPI003BB81226
MQKDKGLSVYKEQQRDKCKALKKQGLRHLSLFLFILDPITLEHLFSYKFKQHLGNYRRNNTALRKIFIASQKILNLMRGGGEGKGFFKLTVPDKFYQKWQRN